jgi:hypothetical protein
MNANKANTLTISGIRTTAGHFLVNVNGSFFFFVTGLSGRFLGKSSQSQWKGIKGEQKLEKMPERIKVAVKEIYKQILGLQASTGKGYGEIFDILSPAPEMKQKLYTNEAVKAFIVQGAKTRVIPKELQLPKKEKAEKTETKAEEIQVVVEKPVVTVLGKMELPKKLHSGNPVVRKHQQQVVVAKAEVKAEVTAQPKLVAVKKIVAEKPTEKNNQKRKFNNKGGYTHPSLKAVPADDEQQKIIEKLNAQPKGNSLGDALAKFFEKKEAIAA